MTGTEEREPGIQIRTAAIGLAVGVLAVVLYESVFANVEELLVEAIVLLGVSFVCGLFVSWRSWAAFVGAGAVPIVVVALLVTGNAGVIVSAAICFASLTVFWMAGRIVRFAVKNGWI